MSSTNDSNAEQGDSSADFTQENPLPSATSLLNRRGLFGKSAACLSTSYDVEKSPELQNAFEEPPNNEADNGVNEENTTFENVSTSELDGKSDSNEQKIDSSIVEPPCEKVVVSMDTSSNEVEESSVESNLAEEITGNDDNEDDEDTPRKRAKRSDPVLDSNEDEDECTTNVENENTSEDVMQDAEIVESIEEKQTSTENKESDVGTCSSVTPEVNERETRSRNSSNLNISNDEENIEEINVESTPKPRRGRSSTVKVDGNGKNEESAEAEKTTSRTRGRQETKKGNSGKDTPKQNNLTSNVVKSAKRGRAVINDDNESKESGEDVDTSKNNTPQAGGRRSTRVRNSTATTPKIETTTPKTRKTPSSTKRARKVSENDVEEIVELENVQESTKVKKTPKSAKNTNNASEQKNTPKEYDPYDMDTEMEKHPEPLKNIHMEVQSFGSVKYAKIGVSASKYTFTEKAAESRISNLSASTPQRKERKSLAEMTPGKEKIQHKTTGILTKSAKKARSRKVDEFEEDEDIDEVKSTENSAKRGRKRKSEVEVASSERSAKAAQLTIPQLSAEEQWKVDHPEDEHEPHGPGARVYANFDKIFYPAIIATERDGLGRFKVKFTSDGIVKDVPCAGIIPIRAVVAGKQCYFNDDVVNVVACPNAASATEWSKGIFEVETIDEDGDGTGETTNAQWTEFTLDMNDWKDYINMKSSQATSIVTDNITTASEMQRAARKKATPVVQSNKPVVNKSVKLKKNDFEPAKQVESRGSEEESPLQMNEKGVGKDIFKGKMFILTSANRQTSASLPIVLKKKVLQDFLESNGGIVTENFADVDANYELDALLVSDTHYRTHKYLAALARAMPCVSNQWVLTCAEEGSCVDYAPYRLPAGISIFDGELYPAPENPGKLFDGKTFYVHSTHNIREVTNNGPGATFIEIWKPIITLLGGTVIDVSAEEIIGQKFDILLTDATFKKEVWKAAEDCGADICTSEWIIQTIILGAPPSFDSHEKFHPSFLTRRREERMRGRNS